MAYHIVHRGWYQESAIDMLCPEVGPIGDATEAGPEVSDALASYSVFDYDPDEVLDRAYATRSEAEAATAKLLGPDGHGVRPIVAVEG